MREILKDGNIILFHTKGFSLFSYGIRVLTKSFFNHTGIFVKGFVIEALGKGVVKTPIEKYINNKKYILKIVELKKEVFFDEQEYQQGISTAIKKANEAIGKKYDWWAIIWLGIKYIGRAYWNKVTKSLPQRLNPFQSRYRFFCSELVATVFYKTSSIYKYSNLFAGEKYQDASTTTPHDIAKAETVKYLAGINKD